MTSLDRFLCCLGAAFMINALGFVLALGLKWLGVI